VFFGDQASPRLAGSAYSSPPEVLAESKRTQRTQKWQIKGERRDEIRHHLTAHTRPFYGSGFCSGQPRWASTKRNIHPLTPIVVISHPLSPSIMSHGILPVQFTCLTVFLHNLCSSFLWSTSWPGTLHFIHTFLHQIIVFFSQHMPIPSQLVSL